VCVCFIIPTVNLEVKRSRRVGTQVKYNSN
jgi:hypothetical protein